MYTARLRCCESELPLLVSVPSLQVSLLPCPPFVSLLLSAPRPPLVSLLPSAPRIHVCIAHPYSVFFFSSFHFLQVDIYSFAVVLWTMW
jgi:hypothetical protein